MIAFTRRYGPPSSVVYFDVNGMKQINDTHGHPAGDAALRHVAEILYKNVRSSDLVGRLGGDEFGVILAQTNQEQATAKAVSLAQEIGKTPLRWGKFKIPVSAAYGVYSFSGSDDAQVAIEAADKAMYTAEAGGVGALTRQRGASGDDVGQEFAFDLRDLVLERQLALLEALQLQLVERHALGDARDHVVEVAVLDREGGQLGL